MTMVNIDQVRNSPGVPDVLECQLDSFDVLDLCGMVVNEHTRFIILENWAYEAR